MKSILDPTFRYTPLSTDIRKTFARIRGEMQRRARPRLNSDGTTNASCRSIRGAWAS